MMPYNRSSLDGVMDLSVGAMVSTTTPNWNITTPEVAPALAPDPWSIVAQETRSPEIAKILNNNITDKSLLIILDKIEKTLNSIEAAEKRSSLHGDTAFIVASAALVFFMTPGLGYFYSGMARSRTALSLILICFLSMAVVLVQVK